jgi:hypothetical protein
MLVRILGNALRKQAPRTMLLPRSSSTSQAYQGLVLQSVRRRWTAADELGESKTKFKQDELASLQRLHRTKVLELSAFAQGGDRTPQVGLDHYAYSPFHNMFAHRLEACAKLEKKIEKLHDEIYKPRGP